MKSDLVAQRVRGDVEILARAGLDLSTLLSEIDASMGRAVGYVGACFALLDPETRLMTKAYKFGDLAHQDNHDHEWATIEYGDVEETTFTELAGGERPAAAVHAVTGGDVVRSRRMRDYMIPYFDYHDELRLVARDQGHLWGGVALFRGPDDEPFSEVDVAFAGSLSPMLAAGLRAGMIVGTVDDDDRGGNGGGHLGPSVVIIDGTNDVTHMSPGTQETLDRLLGGTHAAATAGMLFGMVARARQYAAGRTVTLPRLRTAADDGEWFVLNAAPLATRDGSQGQVVITIEPARPRQVLPLLIAAYDLTAREADVVSRVLHGADTRSIATALHMSAYTVQDHLKAIFRKVGVNSRRELVARFTLD